MADYNEKPFETEICKHLETTGWLYSENSTGYDRARALYPDDVLGWLHDTQPDALDKVIRPGSSTKAQHQAREALLDRLAKTLDAPLTSGGGTLNVLRNGFKHTPAAFKMCQFKPATTKNATTVEAYSKVRVRVMRQVYYSADNTRSVDLVLFINGLPVATLELKTDFTQSVNDAIVQYKTARLPKDPTTKQHEPLFGFGTRAVVHFAVSNDEVWMTTKLAGPDTVFLPFNRGDRGHAGNPEYPGGSPTSYLWREVLDRDTWLQIVGRYLHLETKKSKDPATGRVTTKHTLIFPRYHQWEAVTKLVDAARTDGAGDRYLIQHSAGSGKTRTIAWASHQLATLYDPAGEKVYDSVIVVTDRNVLDKQLQEAITQIETKTGVVATINREEAAKQQLGSKSAYLAQTLGSGKLIIVVTIQTFPFVLEAIRKDKGLAGKKFAVIADEAHSSQTGATANKLKEVLTAEELADVEDGGEVNVEALLAAEMKARAESEDISFLAFTATPKAKTLELFGTRDGDGVPRAFHLYTMQQAIEEGFILDVLKNYTTYKTAFQLKKRIDAGEMKPVKAAEGDDHVLVDEAAATKHLMRWVKLHPTNIAQKVRIIVEHFRENVEHVLDGHAKAMVVTDSRKAAVRYKKAIDAYITKMGYSEVTTLVAFSGDVHDCGQCDNCKVGRDCRTGTPGTGPFNEKTMNPGLEGRDLRDAFATNDYRVMLVANKFQTGFDQPLLVAMYVDRRLEGVTAVQTLSRLNRTYPGKGSTYVLDFVNDEQTILDSFLPYFAEARLETTTDPNVIHDLQAKLDVSGLYTPDDVDAVVEAWVRRQGNNALTAAVTPVSKRFHAELRQAKHTKDHARQDELELFRKDVGTFVRLYDFLSQVVDYGDTEPERRAIFFRLLERRLDTDTERPDVDIAGVGLAHLKQIEKRTSTLDLTSGESKPLNPITGAGSRQKRDPRMVLLEDVLARINELFADEGMTHDQQRSWLEGLLTVLLGDEQLRMQAEHNTKQQFLASPDLRDAVVVAVLGNQTSHSKMADIFHAGGRTEEVLVEALGELMHAEATGQVA